MLKEKLDKSKLKAKAIEVKENFKEKAANSEPARKS